MPTSPDIAAATFGGESPTQSDEDLAALRDMAAASGFRLTPMSEGEQAAVADADPETISAKIKRMAWLKAAAAAAEAQSKAYLADHEAMGRQLQEQMVEEDTARATAGGWTAYFAPTFKLLKTSDEVTTDDILDALREAGQDQMIKAGYNYQTVQAYFKELVKEGLEIPEALTKVLKLEADREVRLRRAGA